MSETTKALPRNVLLRGDDLAPDAAHTLHAGPVSLCFEGGDIRYIRCAGREVVRRIYVALRDANWDTVGGTLRDLDIYTEPDRFRIRYICNHVRHDLHFRWKAQITGAPDGSIAFHLDGEVLKTFRKNRIGFCVLHPISDCVGRAYNVATASSGTKSGTFPEDISPKQIFVDATSLSYEISPELFVDLRFTGDLFEMEDQRNWTDASFKTYCTPLYIPFPAEVREGTKIRQSIEISFRGKMPLAPSGPRDKVSITVRDSGHQLPAIGVQVACEVPDATQLERLKALRLSHLRADAADFDCAARLSYALGVPLEIAVFAGEDPAEELDELASKVRDNATRVARWLVFDRKLKVTPVALLRLARKHLAGAPLIGGTNAYYAELGRQRPDPWLIDGACFSINPQVHAFDDRSLVENCAAQFHAVESARRFLGGRPLYITPVTLRPRFNPNATVAEPPVPSGQLPSQVDPRQMSLFGATWTVASLKHLTQSAPAGITYFESIGWRGVMESTRGSALPDKFPSIAGAVYPLWHVLADVGEFAGGEALTTESDDPLRADMLCLRQAGRLRCLLANLANQETTVRVPGLTVAPFVRVRRLDEENAETAMREPERYRDAAFEQHSLRDGELELVLRPYSVVCIDVPDAP